MLPTKSNRNEETFQTRWETAYRGKSKKSKLKKGQIERNNEMANKRQHK